MSMLEEIRGVNCDSEESVALSTWTRLGKGKERICLLDPNNPKRCLKLSRYKDSRQTVREREYFEYLIRKKRRAPFVPEYGGRFDGEGLIGFYQEAFLKSDGWMSLEEAFSCCDENELERALLIFFDEMVEGNIIISDLTIWNLMVRVTGGKVVRLVAIDGFGPPDHIPLPKHSYFFGYLKIRRQWKKFLFRYEELKFLRKRQMPILPPLRLWFKFE